MKSDTNQLLTSGYVVAYEMPVIKPMTKGIKFG